MTRQEIAVARSHVEVWRQISRSSLNYALVIEDDVYFKRDAGVLIDRAWSDLREWMGPGGSFDMLYLSYRESGPTTEKKFVTDIVFKPVRGLWHMSGYVLSRRGAERLLALLPVRGPVDIWINHQFDKIDVFATSKPAIDQRADAGSDNVYSIVPFLSRAGIISREKPNRFGPRRLAGPVFAWGDRGSGTGPLAMALSMLGYRCCSDLPALGAVEHDALGWGSSSRIFDAYINVGSPAPDIGAIVREHPSARIIIAVADVPGSAAAKASSDPHAAAISVVPERRLQDLGLGPQRLLTLRNSDPDKWRTLCDFLGCEPPGAPYPCSAAGRGGLFAPLLPSADPRTLPSARKLRFDTSPWIAPDLPAWAGRRKDTTAIPLTNEPSIIADPLTALDLGVWRPLSDTFPSNLALFDPDNLAFGPEGARLTFRRQAAQVREYTSASFCSVRSYLYGRFEAELRCARCPGLITGVFMHRYYPRQEIDVEFLGRVPTKMLVNVYYNPGDEGAELNYGYRGTPVLVDLGFDASEAFHRYAIEWGPSGIRWFVDGRLVHERGNWDPTPVPHLPMRFHVNLWSSRSEDLAGKLVDCIRQ